MAVFRIIFALLLALLAPMMVLGQIRLIREQDQMHVLEMIGPFFLAFCCAASSLYCFRPRTWWEAKLACAHCHECGSLRRAALGQPRMSIIAWLIGGGIFTLLYRYAHKYRFRCSACSQPSELRTVGGWLAALWLVLLFFLLATAIYVWAGG